MFEMIDTSFGFFNEIVDILVLFQEIIRHPNYFRSTHENDIALLRLKKEILFTFDIRPACLLVDSADQRSDVKLFVTGWGSISAESKIFMKIS